jgi:prepilin-type N-terminal cleavage/methylation domain-containing protein
MERGESFMNVWLKRLKSNDGFTLIEMMIVGAILSVLVLAFTGYMYQQAKQTKSMSEKQSYNQLKANVLNASAQPDTLTASEAITFDKL